MFRVMHYFALFAICNSFANFSWLNKIVNYSYNTLNQSKNFIPEGSTKKSIIEVGWYEGEIPWDIEPDNYTLVRPSAPKKPITPLKFEEHRAFTHRIICALIDIE